MEAVTSTLAALLTAADEHDEPVITRTAHHARLPGRSNGWVVSLFYASPAPAVTEARPPSRSTPQTGSPITATAMCSSSDGLTGSRCAAAGNTSSRGGCAGVLGGAHSPRPTEARQHPLRRGGAFVVRPGRRREVTMHTRYSLPVRKHTGATAVIVGWHRLLSTFVIHVHGPNHATVVNRGDLYDRITDPRAVVATARQWALIPPDLVAALVADQHA